MNQLTEIEKAYLAGFFDGEGCISLTRQRGGKSISPSYNMRIVIGQSGEKGIKLLDHWKEKTGIGALFEKMRFGEYEKIGFNWVMSSNDALDFLVSIYPYLDLKKDEAELAIDFQETKRVTTFNGRAYGGRGNHGGLDPQVIEERERIYQRLSDMKGALSKRGRKPKAQPV